MFLPQSLLFFASVAFVLGAPTDEGNEFQIDIRSQFDQTIEDLQYIDSISNDGDDAGRASLKEIKDKLKQSVKDNCKCETYKNCQCCFTKEIKLPKIKETFKPKICMDVGVEPEAKLLTIKISLGSSLTIFEKKTSFQSIEEKCKKIEGRETLEFCYKLTVSESEEKGLTSCVKLHVNLMNMFNQPIYLPCLHFKDQKLSIDESFDGYEEGGMKINLKVIWEKIKGLFKKNKKE